ncbi:acyltransferase [Glutamicibacter ardleyensis]
MLLKGARIGSGSILGARALVTRQVPSNSSAAGVPAKVVGNDVFWLRPSVHAYTKAQTEKSLEFASDNFVFTADDSTLNIDALELAISSATTGLEREEWCRTLDSAMGKNRFFMGIPG